MQYNFDKKVERRNTDSLKWNVGENELPMWVADMDFETADEITSAILKRAGHGVYGYSVVPGEWYQAIIHWWERRHNFQMDKEWLLFCTGVVPAISSIVRKMTTVGENVLVQTPVYNIFFNSIVNNGRHILESPLEYENEEYSIDFEDLEIKLSNSQTTMMILCNPHNPVGKIWDKETLKKIGDLCWKHNVLVVSDEIHCDLTEPDCEYIPFASVSEKCRENSITCIAPTKAFNLAGLQTSAIMIPNKNLRHKVNRAINTDEVAEPNTFAITAAIAAFNNGEQWLDELCEYIFENKQIVNDYLKKEIPDIRLVPSKATYLLWLDCRKVAGSDGEFAGFIRKETGLYLSKGSQYGKAGDGFIRMNIACPKETLYEGLTRLKQGVEAYNRQVKVKGV
jgi:cystathionine beta-lyase